MRKPVRHRIRKLVHQWCRYVKPRGPFPRTQTAVCQILLVLLCTSSPLTRAEIPGLSLGPEIECTFVGPVGGPFDPMRCDFQLTNATSSPIPVTATLSVNFEPPWMTALFDGDPVPLAVFEPRAITVPANGSVSFHIELTDGAALVTDPDNAGIFGAVEFNTPGDPRENLAAIGNFAFTQSNDTFSAASAFDRVIGQVSATTTGATKEPGEPNHAGNPGGGSLWWRYDAPAGARGSVSFRTDFSMFDTLLAVYTGDAVDQLQEVAANDDANPSTTESEVSFEITPGETYFVAVDGATRNGVQAQRGFVDLFLTEDLTIANDQFADAVLLQGLEGNITQFVSPTTFFTTEPNEPAHGGGRGGSVWYRWTAQATGVFRFSAGDPGPAGAPTMALYLGDRLSGLIEVASNPLTAPSNQLEFQASNGAEYHLALADSGQSSSYELRWELLSPQPTTGLFASILPASRAVQLGQTATVFANIFNSSPITGENCRPEPPNTLLEFTPTGFDYQTTDTQNALSGAPNTPIDIAPGSVQNFLLQHTSPTSITDGLLGIRFVCDNLPAAPVFPNANGWILRALPFEPADVIAVGVSSGSPGIVDVPAGGATAFAAAGINIGRDAAITVQPETTQTTDLSLNVCETNLAGACLAPPSPTLLIPAFARNELRTFSVFVSSAGTPLSFDPGFNRVFLNFKESVNLVGATSLALRTPD